MTSAASVVFVTPSFYSGGIKCAAIFFLFSGANYYKIKSFTIYDYTIEKNKRIISQHRTKNNEYKATSIMEGRNNPFPRETEPEEKVKTSF